MLSLKTRHDVAQFNPNAFSYSSLKKFENCPKQFAEIVVFQNYKDVFSDAKGGYGDRLHKTAETYVKNHEALPAEFAFLKPILDTLIAVDGIKRTEHKMGILHDGSPTRWNDPNRWYQGIADLSIVGDGTTARVVDYKAGDSKYADTDQLELMALLIFSHFPHVQTVKGALLFVLNEQIRKRTVKREDAAGLLQKYRERHANIIAAHSANNWPMSESGLCKKHCVVLSCPHNGKR